MAEENRAAENSSAVQAAEARYTLEVCNLQKYFPIKGGMLSQPKGYVKAVDGVSFRIRPGTTMTTEATVTKLMWVLANASDFAQMKRLFYTPVNHDIIL